MKTLTMTSPIAPAGTPLAANQLTISCSSQRNGMYLSQGLMGYSEGLPISIYSAMLEELAPSILVADDFDYFVMDEKKQQLAEGDEHKRAPGAQFARETLKTRKERGQTEDKGLTLSLDNRGLTERKKRNAVAYLKARLSLLDLVEFFDVLDSLAVTTNLSWLSANPVDPDESMADAIDAAGDLLGVDPNFGVLSKKVWRNRKKYYKANPATAYIARDTLEDVRDELTLDRLMLNNVRRRQVVGGAKSKILGTVGYFYYKNELASEFDPSSVMHFKSAAEGASDGDFAIFEQPDGALTHITVNQRNLLAAGTGKGVAKIVIT